MYVYSSISPQSPVSFFFVIAHLGRFFCATLHQIANSLNGVIAYREGFAQTSIGVSMYVHLYIREATLVPTPIVWIYIGIYNDRCTESPNKSFVS